MNEIPPPGLLNSRAASPDRTGTERAERSPNQRLEAFSFAEAISTLYENASVALSVHGSAPANGQVVTDETGLTSDRSFSDAVQSSRTAEARRTDQGQRIIAEPTSSTANEPAATAPDPRPQAPPTIFLSPLNYTTASPASIIGQQTAPTHQVQSTSNRSEVPATIRNTLSTTQAGKAARPVTSNAPVPQVDFADLLARRLENGQTRFEIRLDPPELGRVEAQLRLGDDGKSTLSIAFDHETAMDMFLKDQSALFAALTQAGVDLGDGEITYSLRDQDEDPQPSSDSTNPPAVQAIAPQALVASSALDIQV